MLGNEQLNEMICVLATWQRPELVAGLLEFEGKFPVDFTREFLEKLGTDRLRHILLAICLQNNRMPYAPAVAA